MLSILIKIQSKVLHNLNFLLIYKRAYVIKSHKQSCDYKVTLIIILLFVCYKYTQFLHDVSIKIIGARTGLCSRWPRNIIQRWCTSLCRHHHVSLKPRCIICLWVCVLLVSGNKCDEDGKLSVIDTQMVALCNTLTSYGIQLLLTHEFFMQSIHIYTCP